MSGRNNTGQLVLFHRGGACKRKYVVHDYFKYIWNVPAVIFRFDYNAHASHLLMFLIYFNGVCGYTFAIKGLSIGHVIITRDSQRLHWGDTSYIKNIRAGSFICNLEIRQFKGGQFLRAGGSFGIIISSFMNKILVKLRSRSLLYSNPYCIATWGIPLRKPVSYNRCNAGYFRRLGWRPRVRGVAMNPIDHPHGCMQISVSRWGWLTKTRCPRSKNKKKYIWNDAFCVKR